MNQVPETDIVEDDTVCSCGQYLATGIEGHVFVLPCYGARLHRDCASRWAATLRR